MPDIRLIQFRAPYRFAALCFAGSLLLCACSAPPATVHLDNGEYFKIPKSISDGPQEPLDGCVDGVDNFGLISREVWRGACPTPQGMQSLARLGVKTIIDLQEDDESAVVPVGVRYVHLPVSAWHADQVDVHGVLRAIADNPKPVFIHCWQGRDRTGLAIAAYRLTQGMSDADACKELHNFRVNVWWAGPIERRIHQLNKSRLSLKSR